MHTESYTYPCPYTHTHNATHPPHHPLMHTLIYKPHIQSPPKQTQPQAQPHPGATHLIPFTSPQANVRTTPSLVIRRFWVQSYFPPQMHEGTASGPGRHVPRPSGIACMGGGSQRVKPVYECLGCFGDEEELCIFCQSSIRNYRPVVLEIFFPSHVGAKFP